MARLVWGSPGSRYYEVGVDRGVLYVDGIGVAWNGLVSVDETSSGGEINTYYLDGLPYLNLSSSEEFEATIEAYYSPPEFDACDGMAVVADGLFATRQPRKSFDLCYRTLIGNDIDGPDGGYKLHLIYNASASPTQRSHETISENIDAATLSWSITAKPMAIPDAAPSAHLIIDTSTTFPAALNVLENILYGNESEIPRIPTPDELFEIIVGNNPLDVIDNGDGTATIAGSDKAVKLLDNDVARLIASSITMIDESSFTISSQFDM